MAELDLSGTWRLRWSDGQHGKAEQMDLEEVDEDLWVDAAVPGEAHLEAVKQGWMPDPYTGAACVLARWVEEYFWYYRRRFTAPAEALAGRAWLYFEAADLVASIRLNGREVAKHKNFFRPCRVEVTGKLRPGENLLTVHLESGLYEVADKPGEGWLNSPDQRLHKRHWLRKPQFQFLWDWSTRLINVGLQGPVRLEWEKGPVRVEGLTPLVTWDPVTRKGQVKARLFVEGLWKEAGKEAGNKGAEGGAGAGNPPAGAGNPAGPRTGALRVSLPELGAAAETAVTLKPGEQVLEAVLEVDDPETWWPTGLGAQRLHRLEVELTLPGAVPQGGALSPAVSIRRAAKIGFRSVRMVEDADPQGGRFCFLEINGRKVFAKGANLVPADMILGRIDRARYETLVDRALELNFNLLRVWGGGVYEADAFYEICDERGILVWQEFIYACGRYPTHDEKFLAEAKAEARYQVRRLAGHASLILWCGNNENEWASWDWGWDRGVTYPDYGFFHMVLPRLLAEEDPSRPYRPSSPMSPDMTHPNRDDRGDQHPWDIPFVKNDFRLYRTLKSRFANEGGLLGPTSLKTMKACLEPGSSLGPEAKNSFAWQLHDNTICQHQYPSLVNELTALWLGKPFKSLSVEEYCYYGGLLMGEALKEYCQNFRRRMYGSASAVFWMYNDCWPATRSWTVVDYYLRRTPAFHPVRRAMKPVKVVVAEEGAEVVVFGVNEGNQPVTARLRYGLFETAGGYPLDLAAEVVLLPNASTRLAAFPKEKWTDPASQVAFAGLEGSTPGAQGTGAGEQGGQGEDRLLDRDRLILPLFRELKWEKPQVTVKLEQGVAVFTSPVFVMGVCLDLDGEESLPDNFFDIFPGQDYRLPWKGPAAPKVLYTGNLA